MYTVEFLTLYIAKQILIVVELSIPKLKCREKKIEGLVIILETSETQWPMQSLDLVLQN